MKKSYWKKRAKTAEDRANWLEGENERATGQVVGLQIKVEALTRELEDKRKNWAPIKIKHPYTPRDATCMYCDDPAEDPRHGNGGAA